MISDEAVEAAAKATFEHTNFRSPWEGVSAYWADIYRDAARCALEAAAPYIRAEALEEAADDYSGVDHGVTSNGHVRWWLRDRAAEMSGSNG